MEDLTEVPTPSDASSPAERRRMPRLCIAHEQFRLKSSGKIFMVADLSLDGMALRIVDGEDVRHFSLGRKFEGLLSIDRQKHPIDAQVMHLGKDLVGCQFGSTLSEATRAALASFLDPKRLGQGLRPLPSVERGMLWYQGPSDTQVLLWRGTDGQYFRWMVCFLGAFVRWEESTDPKTPALSTGRLDPSFEPSDVRGAIRFETVRLSLDEDLDTQKTALAKIILENSPLAADLVAHLTRKLVAGHSFPAQKSQKT